MTLTPDQLAERWHVNVSRVHAWVRSGELAAIELGPRTRVFRESDVIDFEERRRSYTPPDTPHDFRRWTATELDDAIGRDAAQLVLGHTTPQMTATYISRRDTLLERAAGAMQEALEAAL